MTEKKLTVVQCWDDGVTADIPLIEILRKYNAKASFNLNAGLHSEERGNGWNYQDTEVLKLAWGEMKEVYKGFTIANHSLTHPWLNKISPEEAFKDISEGRKKLQDFFGQEVKGFVYPCGGYNEEVMDLLRKAGHTYARTTKNCEQCYPPDDPMAFHSTCKFDADDFWDRYEKSRECGVFYFWGHSYEIINDEMKADIEDKIKRITEDPLSQWGELSELF